MKTYTRDQIISYIKTHQGEEITGEILSKHFYYNKKYMYSLLNQLEEQGYIKRINTMIIPKQED